MKRLWVSRCNNYARVSQTLRIPFVPDESSRIGSATRVQARLQSHKSGEKYLEHSDQRRIELMAQINRLINAKSLDAYDRLVEYGGNGWTIPHDIMTSFLSLVQSEAGQLSPYLYRELVHLSSPRHIRQYLHQVIKLYLSQDDMESALSFIKEIQLANTGQLTLDYYILESLLISAKYHKDAGLAWKITQTISQSYPKVYARTWGLLISVVLEVGHFKALEWIHKEACVPGYIVLDDHGYLRMAEIAALNGSLTMAQWAALRMKRRHRVLGIQQEDNSISQRLFACLVEAASVSSVSRHGKEPGASSIRAACRYLVRLSDAAAELDTKQFPRFVEALDDKDNYQFVEGVFIEMCSDAGANPSVRTLFHNLILANFIHQSKFSEAIQFVGQSRSHPYLLLNEESYLLLIKLGLHHRDLALIDSVSAEMPTKRVLQAAASAEKRIASEEV